MDKKNELLKNEYVVKIADIMSDIKSINLEVTISEIKKFEFKKGVIVALNLKDESGSLLGFLIVNRDDNNNLKIIKNLEINKLYKAQGNVFIITNNIYEELSNDEKEIFNKLNININDKILGIRKIEKM